MVDCRSQWQGHLATFESLWTFVDIFTEPRGQNPVTQNGQPILRVNIMNPAQTGMPPITPDELSSVTLGSFQPRLVRSYVTNQR